MPTADPQDWRTSVKRAFILGDGGIVMQFDSVIRESHSSELTVTENPVETGVVVADHAFMQPARLEIEAAVGDVWLHGKDENGNPVDDLFSSDAGRRSFVAFVLLQDLQAAAEPFSVQTGLRLYQNMVITNLSADQDKDTAAFLGFHASLREVLIVSTQTVTYPPRAPGKTTRQASKKVSGGEQKGQPVTDPVKAKSVLDQGIVVDGKIDIQAAIARFFSLPGSGG